MIPQQERDFDFTCNNDNKQENTTNKGGEMCAFWVKLECLNVQNFVTFTLLGGESCCFNHHHD